MKLSLPDYECVNGQQDVDVVVVDVVVHVVVVVVVVVVDDYVAAINLWINERTNITVRISLSCNKLFPSR